MAAAKRRSSPRMLNATRLGLLPGSGFSLSNVRNFARGLGKAPRFDFPDELQRCLGKAPAGGIKPKDGRETVATPQHGRARTMGRGVAQELFQLLALSDEPPRIGRRPGEQDRRLDIEDAGKYRSLIVFAGVLTEIRLFDCVGIRA